MAAMETEAAAEAMAYDGVVPETRNARRGLTDSGAGSGGAPSEHVAQGTFPHTRARRRSAP